MPFLLLAAPIAASLWRMWTRSIWDNGHGVFVPPLMAYFAARALRRESMTYEEPSRWGYAFLLPALTLVAIDGVIKTDYLRAIGLMLSLSGLSLLLLGPSRTRALRFPLVFSFFMLPVPPAILTPMHEHLRVFTAASTEWLLHLLRRPALAEGTILQLPHGMFHVVDECSGFAALYASITIALALAHLSHSRARRVLLLAVAAPLALGSNVLRVTLLAILAESRGYGILATPIHVASGYATFVVSLGLLFLFAEHGHRRSAR